MCVKLPSVSKWGRIVPTDVAALNGTHLSLHRHYIMQITTMKEVKSGERQKGTDRWEMRFSPTPIRCINHIKEGLEHKRTYARWQPRRCFSPLFSEPEPFKFPSLLVLSSWLARQHPIMEYFLRGYGVWESILISARSSEARTAKLTAN